MAMLARVSRRNRAIDHNTIQDWEAWPWAATTLSRFSDTVAGTLPGNLCSFYLKSSSIFDLGPEASSDRAVAAP